MSESVRMVGTGQTEMVFIGSIVLWTSVQEYVDRDFTFVWNIALIYQVD